MKKLLPFFFVFGVINASAQTFTASPGSSITSLSTRNSTIAVSGVGVINCAYGLQQVCINISHTYDADLDIYLIDPNGDSYMLTTDNGGSGDNYSVTCFDMSAATNVTAGSAPFNGTYKPEGNFGNANNYQNADGNWTLSVYDDALLNTGTLVSWSLVFGSEPPCLEPMTADCFGGITVCTDETFLGNSIGSGNYSELIPTNDGCLFGEHQSSWYFFEAATDGTYAFMIETVVDYDFALWGPLAALSCPPAAPPTRCSYSGNLGFTGLQAGSGDNSEDEFGNGTVNPITASAHDVFILLIDNYTADGTSFELVWTLTGGATFDCALLPVELSYFEVERQGNVNVVAWETLSEKNNAEFILEKSKDGQSWSQISHTAAAGNSTGQLDYSCQDIDNSNGIVYYRLCQVDFDGVKTEIGEISLNNGEGKEVEKIVNLLGVEVTENYAGLKIYVYTDGTSAKFISE